VHYFWNDPHMFFVSVYENGILGSFYSRKGFGVVHRCRGYMLLKWLFQY